MCHLSFCSCRDESTDKHGVNAEKVVPTTNPLLLDGGSDIAGQHGVKLQSSQRHFPSKPLQPAILQPFLEKASDAEGKQHYKMAASLYEQVKNTEEGKPCLPFAQTLASELHKHPAHCLC